MRFSVVPFFFKTPSLVEPRRTIRIVKRQRALLTTSLLTLIAVKRQFPGKIAQYDVSVLRQNIHRNPALSRSMSL